MKPESFSAPQVRPGHSSVPGLGRLGLPHDRGGFLSVVCVHAALRRKSHVSTDVKWMKSHSSLKFDVPHSIY